MSPGPSLLDAIASRVADPDDDENPFGPPGTSSIFDPDHDERQRTNRRLLRFAIVDSSLRSLRRCREQLTPSLARAAAAYRKVKGWKFFADSTLTDHAREQLDMTERSFQDLAAIGDGLQDLPELEVALTGRGTAVDDPTALQPLGRTKAAALARVATPETFGAWAALARSTTWRAFAKAVQAAKAAGSPLPLSKDGGGDPAGGGIADEAREPSDLEDDVADAREIRIGLPEGMKIAFDEVHDLHQAVCGANVPRRDFVEALVAEALAGDRPVDLEARAGMLGVGLRRGKSLASVEDSLAALAGNWRDLDQRNRSTIEGAGSLTGANGLLDEECRELVATAQAACERIRALTREAGTGGPAELNRQLRGLLSLEKPIDRALTRLLGWLSRHRSCGENLFRDIGHYGAERIGMRPRDAQLRAFIDRRLRRLPILREAFYAGRLGLEAAAVLCRILHPGPVKPEIERAWLEHALKSTVRRLRDEARTCTRSEAAVRLGEDPPLPPGDEAWFRSLARFPGTTKRRLTRLVDDHGPSWPSVLNDTMTLRLPAETADRFVAAVEDRRRHAPGGLASAPAASRLAKTFSDEGEVVPAWVGLLALLEDYVGVWDDPALQPRRRYGRIYAMWGWRCAAPGCTRRCTIESHHLHYLSHCGPDIPSNLLPLCAFHHRQGEHGFLASCSGKAPLGVSWSLGHPSVKRHFRNDTRPPPAAEVWRFGQRGKAPPREAQPRDVSPGRETLLDPSLPTTQASTSESSLCSDSSRPVGIAKA